MRPGDILGGKYRVGASIGRGGMGEVFAAHDLEVGMDVALKVVRRQGHGDLLLPRLLREAEASLRIRSDYVPRAIDVSSTDAGDVFLVMERLEGITLAGHLAAHGPLAWEEAATIAEDVLRGLIDAHAAGVVHRDLKPSNVFLVGSPGGRRAMILDFGVCKLDSTDTDRLTATNESVGTVAYMAPEQVRGASAVDARADLFAFGAVVYEMLTGRLPHEGPTPMAILASKEEHPPAPFPDEAHTRVPEGVEAIVLKALSREREERFGSARALLEAWRVVHPRGRASVPPIAPPSARPPPASRPSGPVTSALRFTGAEPTVFDPTPPASLEPCTRGGGSTAAWQAFTFGGTSGRTTRGTRLALTVAALGLAAGLLAITVAAVRAPEAHVIVSAPSAAREPRARAASATASPLEREAEGGVFTELSEDDGRAPSPRATSEGDGRAPSPSATSKRGKARPAGTSKPTAKTPRLTAEPRY